MNSFNRELDISPCYASDNSSASSINTASRTALDEEVYATVETSGPKRRAGRKKFRETRHPVYKGVRRRNGSKWVCEVREPNKKSRIWLGTYPTAEMAARAHDVAAMALRGRRACLNFADSAWRLPMPVSSSAKDIQKAAAEAAEAFRPSDSDDASTDDSDIAPEKLTLSQEEAAEAFRPSDSNEASNDDSDIALEKLTLSQENVLYMDEEAVFGMPGLLASLAEGLLLSPPLCHGSGPYWDDVETEVDMSLWSY